jgi:hypothetical protein
MSSQSEIQLERDALSSPVSARLRLATKLLASVPDSSRPRLNEEQALELAERRAMELDNGEVQGLDYRDEMRRIRDSLSR